MIPKDLLFQLSQMESHLDDFSIEKLTMDEAAHLKKSFLSFKKNLFDIISPPQIRHRKDSWEILKKTVLNFEKTDVSLDGAVPDLDMETYDAIIEHYKSYGAVLKSLQIESAVKKENKSTLIVNNGISSVTDSTEEIDLSSILKECMGEIELLAELVLLYESNALEFIGAAKIHLKTADYKQLGLSAHKVKAGLAMMKTKGLHSIILQIERACSIDKDSKHLKFLCMCFAAEFPMVQKALNKALVDLVKNKS